MILSLGVLVSGFEEWERAKSATMEDKATQLTLAASDGPGLGVSASPVGKDLAVEQDDLEAIGNAAYSLHQGLGKEGNHAQNSSASAANGLKKDNFETGSALQRVTDVWQKQVSTLATACAHISNHLDYSSKNYQENEDKIRIYMKDVQGREMNPSRIEKYFK